MKIVLIFSTDPFKNLCFAALKRIHHFHNHLLEIQILRCVRFF